MQKLFNMRQGNFSICKHMNKFLLYDYRANAGDRSNKMFLRQSLTPKHQDLIENISNNMTFGDYCDAVVVNTGLYVAMESRNVPRSQTQQSSETARR